MQSRRVRFTTAASLVNELIEARDDHTLSKVIARYACYLRCEPESSARATLLDQLRQPRLEIGQDARRQIVELSSVGIGHRDIVTDVGQHGRGWQSDM